MVILRYTILEKLGHFSKKIWTYFNNDFSSLGLSSSNIALKRLLSFVVILRYTILDKLDHFFFQNFQGLFIMIPYSSAFSASNIALKSFEVTLRYTTLDKLGHFFQLFQDLFIMIAYARAFLPIT